MTKKTEPSKAQAPKKTPGKLMDRRFNNQKFVNSVAGSTGDYKSRQVTGK